MQEQYYAVVRTGSQDELQHWKYIKKKKVNGKWLYFYDQGEVDKYKNNQTQVYTEKDGTKVRKVWKEDKKSWVSSKSTLKSSGSTIGFGISSDFKSKKVEYTRGKADRFIDKKIAKGEKYIYDNFLNKKKKKTKKKKSSIKSRISKGASWFKRKMRTR